MLEITNRAFTLTLIPCTFSFVSSFVLVLLTDLMMIDQY